MNSPRCPVLFSAHARIKGRRRGTRERRDRQGTRCRLAEPWRMPTRPTPSCRGSGVLRCPAPDPDINDKVEEALPTCHGRVLPRIGESARGLMTRGIGQAGQRPMPPGLTGIRSGTSRRGVARSGAGCVLSKAIDAGDNRLDASWSIQCAKGAARTVRPGNPGPPRCSPFPNGSQS